MVDMFFVRLCASLLVSCSFPLTVSSPPPPQYRDPEEIEREQEAQAAAKALPAAEEPAAEARVSEWEVSGSNAAIAAAASSQVPTSAETGPYPLSLDFLFPTLSGGGGRRPFGERNAHLNETRTIGPQQVSTGPTPRAPPTGPPPSESPPRHVVVEVSFSFRSFCSTSSNHDRLLSLVVGSTVATFRGEAEEGEDQKGRELRVAVAGRYAIVPLFSLALFRPRAHFSFSRTLFLLYLQSLSLSPSGLEERFPAGRELKALTRAATARIGRKDYRLSEKRRALRLLGALLARGRKS